MISKKPMRGEVSAEAMFLDVRACMAGRLPRREEDRRGVDRHFSDAVRLVAESGGLLSPIDGVGLALAGVMYDVLPKGPITTSISRAALRSAIGFGLLFEGKTMAHVGFAPVLASSVDAVLDFACRRVGAWVREATASAIKTSSNPAVASERARLLYGAMQIFSGGVADEDRYGAELRTVERMLRARGIDLDPHEVENTLFVRAETDPSAREGLVRKGGAAGPMLTERRARDLVAKSGAWRTVPDTKQLGGPGTDGVERVAVPPVSLDAPMAPAGAEDGSALGDAVPGTEGTYEAVEAAEATAAVNAVRAALGRRVAEVAGQPRGSHRCAARDNWLELWGDESSVAAVARRVGCQRSNLSTAWTELRARLEEDAEFGRLIGRLRTLAG